MSDTDHEAVYAAERAAFDGTDLETLVDFDRVADSISAVTAGPWWPGPAVRVRAARRDARSSSATCTGAGQVGERDSNVEIRLAAGQLTVATAAHELAHALAGPDAGHGALFRGALVDVLAVITNLSTSDRRRDLHVTQLAAAFDAAGLRPGVRRWPAPPSALWGAIAL